MMEMLCFRFTLVEEFKFSTLTGALLNALSCFFILTVLSMLITYIASLKGRIMHLMAENLNLLDKMHEGLIVVSKDDLGLQFASAPAISLIKKQEKSKIGIGSRSF